MLTVCLACGQSMLAADDALCDDCERPERFERPALFEAPKTMPGQRAFEDPDDAPR